jgi:type III pantothenate kinase
VTAAGTVCVAIDIGNSAAKWSVQKHDQAASPLQRVSLNVDHWHQQVIGGSEEAAAGGPVYWRIAAVNAPACHRLVDSLKTRGQSEVTVLKWSDIPIKALLPQPDRLGLDRLLAAWKATSLFPGQRVIVVDAGSAITIDCASSAGEFLGGVIMPGLSLQFDSLARGTDALPSLRLSESSAKSAADLPVPATNTIAAIQSGILLGTAAAIDRLVERSGAAEPFRLALTGGDAARLSPLITHPHEVLPRLVVDAILACVSPAPCRR